MLEQTVLFVVAKPALRHAHHDNSKIELSGTASKISWSNWLAPYALGFFVGTNRFHLGIPHNGYSSGIEISLQIVPLSSCPDYAEHQLAKAS